MFRQIVLVSKFVSLLINALKKTGGEKLCFPKRRFRLPLSYEPTTILPKIPEERKMIVMTKLQQVFCDEDLLSGFGGQHRLQPMHHPPHNYGSSPCGSSTSDTWESCSQAPTPLSTAQHEDLASFF
ncbi:hypothetical protein J6590_075184 [Homalodisca vitripennis]|nr:hypothetical protein J6590_075184 [Homalodisca vitripennis]